MHIPKMKTITFFKRKVYLHFTKKTNKQTKTKTKTKTNTKQTKQNKTKKHHTRNFACYNYIFPETRANKSKQWTHYCALKREDQSTQSESELKMNSYKLLKGPYADHILIPQGSTGSKIFFDIK